MPEKTVQGVSRWALVKRVERTRESTVACASPSITQMIGYIEQCYKQKCTQLLNFTLCPWLKYCETQCLNTTTLLFK